MVQSLDGSWLAMREAKISAVCAKGRVQLCANVNHPVDLGVETPPGQFSDDDVQF